MTFQQLAAIVGTDNAWRLCRECGGRAVYIPEKPLFPGAADEAAAMHRRGYNHHEISMALNFKISAIKKLLREAGVENWRGAGLVQCGRARP